MRRYFRPFAVLLCLLALYCFAHESPNPLHREINNVSISPDSKKLAYLECFQTPARHCGVFIYDRENASAKQLNLPEGYVYREPNFSPDGEALVMSRIQRIVAKDWETTRDVLENTAFVVFNLRTQELTVLPIPHGHKYAPVYSPNGKQLAYFRSDVSLGFRFIHYGNSDVFTFDLEKQKEQQFSAPFRFEQGYSIVFESADVLLVNATSPRGDDYEIPAVRDYDETKVDIFRIRRGAPFSAAPLDGAKPGSSKVELDHQRRYYYLVRRLGDHHILRRNLDGSEQRWSVTQFLNAISIAPDGKTLIAIFSDPEDLQANNKHFVKELDLSTTVWRDLPTAKSIAPPAINSKRN